MSSSLPFGLAMAIVLLIVIWLKFQLFLALIIDEPEIL